MVQSESGEGGNACCTWQSRTTWPACFMSKSASATSPCKRTTGSRTRCDCACATSRLGLGLHAVPYPLHGHRRPGRIARRQVPIGEPADSPRQHGLLSFALRDDALPGGIRRGHLPLHKLGQTPAKKSRVRYTQRMRKRRDSGAHTACTFGFPVLGRPEKTKHPTQEKRQSELIPECEANCPKRTA